VVITEQTHRGDNFTPRGSLFRSSSRFRLESCATPAWEGDSDEMYLRGYREASDDREFTMPLHVYSQFREAVKEYNEKYKE